MFPFKSNKDVHSAAEGETSVQQMEANLPYKDLAAHSALFLL